jgi:signal peptidase I
VSSRDRPVSNIASLTPIVPSTSVEEPPSSTQSRLRSTIEWLAVVVTALAAALLIKEYVFQAFEIPSASMERTVNVGDRILVNKLSYSFGDVQRGDLVVFERLEGAPGSTDDLIKRAIALPGETIEVRSDGRIWIWGPGETAEDAALLEEPYLDVQNAVLSTPRASDALTQDIWDTHCVNQPREPGRCTLDDSSYFMMGDNRNASADSRFFGPVPDENVVGRAFARIWPLGDVSTL